MLERSSNSPQAASRAQQAAEDQWAHVTRGENVQAPSDEARKGAFVATFIAGAEWALPEEPDPAVIEAMAKALFLDHGTDQAGETAPEIAKACERMARAAYAAMRGAMQ